MSTIDYEKIGFKAGIEIHQELETSRKLFCLCSPELTTDKADFLITRYFRPVLGELGEYDRQMIVEFDKDLTVIYEGYNRINCSYEIDETPPFEPDFESIDICLELALLLNAHIVDELHVCRKNYLDGSVPCGFQRTIYVGTDGYVPLPSGKKIGITTICCEEDAARKIKQEGRKVFYRLDRLGIPLVEIVTDPDCSNPDEVFETALRLGLLLRSSKVKRGIGTIRQDLNVSIKGGARVELKGVQKLDWLTKLVENEVKRQIALLEITNELKSRNITEEMFKYDFKNANNIFKDTESKFVKGKLKKEKVLLAVKLPGMSGLLGKEIQPGKRFGTELAERVTIQTGVKGLIHSDENMEQYGISDKETQTLGKLLELEKNDAFVFVIADEDKGSHALRVVVDRTKQCLEGVPPETRAALENGNSMFTRELGGEARLYPDTDTPPIIIGDRLDKIKKTLPKEPWVLEKEMAEKYDIEKSLARKIILSGRVPLFEKITGIGVSPVLVATTLTQTLVALRREGLPVENIAEEHLISIFKALSKKKIAKEAIDEILRLFAEDPSLTLEKTLEQLSLETMSLEDLQKLIAEVIEKNYDLVKSKGDRAFGPIMGIVMKEARGKIDGKIISEKVREELKRILEAKVN